MNSRSSSILVEGKNSSVWIVGARPFELRGRALQRG